MAAGMYSHHGLEHQHKVSAVIANKTGAIVGNSSSGTSKVELIHLRGSADEKARRCFAHRHNPFALCVDLIIYRTFLLSQQRCSMFRGFPPAGMEYVKAHQALYQTRNLTNSLVKLHTQFTAPDSNSKTIVSRRCC
jgi:hypothetical protein